METDRIIKTTISFSNKPSYTRLGILSKLLDKKISETLVFLSSSELLNQETQADFLKFQKNQDTYPYRKTIKFGSLKELWSVKETQKKTGLSLDLSIDFLIYSASKKLFHDQNQFDNFWEITSSFADVERDLSI